jgi:hypothetical protein
LKVRLPDVASSMGARVSVTTGSGRTMHDWLVAGEGLVSDQTHILTFGFGDEEICQRIEVRFMDGRTRTIDNPPIDSTIDVTPSISGTQIDGNVNESA